jgi:hypothetical protein
MEDAEFNVGDRVRINNNCSNMLLHNLIGFIEEVWYEGKSYIVRIPFTSKEDERYCLEITSLDLLKKGALGVVYHGRCEIQSR